MANCDVTQKSATNNGIGNTCTMKTHQSLIRKRKSRNTIDYYCICLDENNFLPCSSCSLKSQIHKSLSKCKSTLGMKFSHRCYIPRVTLFCLLGHLLCITSITECIDIKDHTSERPHHYHHHNKFNNKHHYNMHHDVQAIQPKICHSLTSSNSYLSSAFAHNFASQRSNDLSMENKLVLSPIVFQGISRLINIHLSVL